MVKINIKNNLGVITHSGTFKTQEEANQWISLNADSGAWGKPERSLYVQHGKTLADFGEVESDVSSFTESEYLGKTSKTYVLKQAFSIESEDVTQEFLARKKAKERAKKRAFGESLIDKISSLNEAKNLSTAQVDAFMDNPLVANLREHLWAGNVDTFLSKLTASDVSAFFTAEEKSAVITECREFLNNIGG